MTENDLAKRRIGLALSGGAARGLAHLGVLSVLIRESIPIDCIAACSAGAILGAAFCAGMSIDEMGKFSRYLTWRRLASPVRADDGFLRLDKMERWLIMLLGDVYFSDLELPFAIVAMDTESGERVVIREGRVARAVRASCSIPGFVTPVFFDGRLLADGGVVDNLPVDVARDLGADFVIGVDVFEPLYSRVRGPLGKGLTAVETLIRNSGGGVGRADFLIAPKTAGRTYVRFSRQKELITLGQRAAEGSLTRLLNELPEGCMPTGNSR